MMERQRNIEKIKYVERDRHETKMQRIKTNFENTRDGYRENVGL